jgi:Uma2 family endonuclease
MLDHEAALLLKRGHAMKTKVRLGRYASGMLLTPAEFDAVTNYDRRYRYELINGVVIVNPIPRDAQSSPNDELGFLFRFYKYHHPQGKRLDDTMPERYIRLANSRRLADRVVWAGLGRLPDTAVDVPTIAVEFVSRRKRDRVRDYKYKKKEYPAAGVKEYWIIDPFRRIMTVCMKRRGKVTDRIIKEHETYQTDLLPGFVLELAPLLALADAYEKQRAKRKK